MRLFIIDTSNTYPELQGELIGVEGSSNPTAAEKQECVETVSPYMMDGWAIAADPQTPIGDLAAPAAETACVPFVNLTGLSGAGRGLCRATGSNEFGVCASKPSSKHNV